MLSRLGNPLWMQEDGGQEEGRQEHQQHQHAPPPAMGPGLMPSHGQEDQNLLALAAAVRGPGMLDDEWYFDPVAAAAGSQLFNMGGAAPFDLGLSGGGELASIPGTGSASNAASLSSPIPSGHSGFLGSFRGFGTLPAQMPELTGLDVLGDGAGSSWAPPPASASLTAPFAARGKAAPLMISPPVAAQPTLFQKRALRGRNAGEEEAMVAGASSDVKDNSTVPAGGAGNGKGKNNKGSPAKNLMAERRRRKNLNDLLYMLRSVVPKISKMDRASILGDAIEHLKELLQKSKDLQKELESSPSTASLPPTLATSFHPLTPTLPTLPSRVKEELCRSAFPHPTAQQPSVEVRMREGRAVNIHMFCARRPGLLLSAIRAIENLGLDVEQAVISCCNGFSLDIFKAEPSKEGQGLLPEEIKAILLQSLGFRGAV